MRLLCAGLESVTVQVLDLHPCTATSPEAGVLALQEVVVST